MESIPLADRLRLTVITDEALARPRTLSDVVRKALGAGAPTIQLRLKGASARELLEAAHMLLPIVRSAGALFIVNDRLDVALAAGADGVHLGPDDPPLADARAVADTHAVRSSSARYGLVRQWRRSSSTCSNSAPGFKSSRIGSRYRCPHRARWRRYSGVV